jgi:hypothetical protein
MEIVAMFCHIIRNMALFDYNVVDAGTHWRCRSLTWGRVQNRASSVCIATFLGAALRSFQPIRV